MVIIRLEDLASDVGGYFRRAEAGEELVVLRDEQPIAEIRPLIGGRAHEPRPIGLCAGELVVSADFDDPLPEHVLREFEGG
jgi:antitoxin (DNA-binding transcriptional repressor) of toxin-antitoxin stability system